MFKNNLIANCGDQPHIIGVAAQPNCLPTEPDCFSTAGQAGDFATEVLYV
jgi:hypothetical protein